MAKIEPADPDAHSGSGPQASPPAPARGGGFTFLLAACALGVSLYLVYTLEVFGRLPGAPERAPAAPVTPVGAEGFISGAADQSLLDNLAALEERMTRLEEAGSRMEVIIEQLGQEVGSVQGISEQRSSIPLYRLRISLADIRLRITGDPQQVVQSLKATVPFIPAEESALRSVLEDDIARLEELPAREHLVRSLDLVVEALSAPLKPPSGDALPQQEGALGALMNMVNARRADPPQLAFLRHARESARRARTLLLVGDRENYLAELQTVTENLPRLSGQYDQAALDLADGTTAELVAAGLPEYHLDAARPL